MDWAIHGHWLSISDEAKPPFILFDRNETYRLLYLVKLAHAQCPLSGLALLKTAVSDKFECMPSVLMAGSFSLTPGDVVHQNLISGNSLEPHA